jgi:hypothetical protein
VLSHIPAPDLILAAFVLAIALWVLLSELLPGNRRDDDPPDTSEDDRDPGPAALRLAA